jgi:D-alanyl-D-alanine carboxypeptidase
MKRRILFIFSGMIITLAAGLIVLKLQFSIPSYNDLNQEMEYLVLDLVKKDKTVKNCVLYVMKGDGSFSWSGAAGIARQDGQVPMTKDTPIYIASITKLYTATVIMRMYEKGLLSLDDPMSKYLPEGFIKGIHVYNGKDYSREITIKQLLSHTSGIADYYSEKSNDGKSLFELFLNEPKRSWTVEEPIERARKDLKPHFLPGTGTSYSDTNFQLLGKVIEAISKKPLQSVYENLIFTPLNLKHTWLIGCQMSRGSQTIHPADVYYRDINITKIRLNSSYWADGGIVSIAEEMIVFLKALNEERIIRKESLDLMHQWHKLNFPLQYGYGTMYFKLPWIMEKAIGMSPLWGHSGSTASFLYYSQDNDLYLAGTLNQTESKRKPFILMLKVIKANQSKKQV